MTTERRDTYITKEDMVANRDRREDDKNLSPEDREAFEAFRRRRAHASARVNMRWLGASMLREFRLSVRAV